MLQSDTSNTLLIINEIIDNGFDGQHFIVGLGKHLRSLLVARDPATVKLMEVSGGLAERYQEQAAQCSSDFLLKALSINNSCDINYRSSNNKRLHLEIALLQICGLQQKPADQSSAPGLAAPAPKAAAPKPQPAKPATPQATYKQTETLESEKPMVREVAPPVKKNHAFRLAKI